MLLPLNTFVFGGHIGLIIALVPLYMFDQGYDVGAIGMIVAAQAVFQLGLRLFSGVMADRYGEQRVMSAGFVSMTVSALIFVVWSDLWLMIVAQLFTGASRAAFMPASNSYASRIDEADAPKAIGRSMSASTVGSLMGPFAGGVLAATLGFQAGFAVAATVSVVGLAVSRLLPGLPRAEPKPIKKALARVPVLLLSRSLALAGVVGFWTALAVSVMFSVFIVHLREGDANEIAVGLVLAVMISGTTITSFAFSSILARVGRRGVFAMAFGVSGAANFALASTEATWLILPLAMLSGAGLGLGATLRSVLAAAGSVPAERGIALSVAGLWWATGMLIGPLAFGLIAAEVGPARAIQIAGGLLMALAALTPVAFAVLSPKSPDATPDVAAS